jgi:hypothetical protein
VSIARVVGGAGAGVDAVSEAAVGESVVVVAVVGSDLGVLVGRGLRVGLERVYFVVMRVCGGVSSMRRS